MKHSRLIVLAVLALVAVSGQAQAPAPAAAAKKIQVLVITGQNGHDWRSCSPYLRQILEETGKFEVRIVEEFRGASAATLAPYDVVVLNYSDWRKKPGLRWGDSTDQAFLDYVKSGKGLVSYHFSASAFEGWEEYDRLIGGAWRTGHGGHSKYHDFKVDIKDKEHPITRGLNDSYPQSDELYANLVMQPDIRVLATAWDDPALDKGSGKNQPMLWVKSYGAGRVFATALGHDVPAMKPEVFRVTLVRGAEWAATGNVTIPPK
jgi:type 1 glutamine amidotransferase